MALIRLRVAGSLISELTIVLRSCLRELPFTVQEKLEVLLSGQESG